MVSRSSVDVILMVCSIAPSSKLKSSVTESWSSLTVRKLISFEAISIRSEIISFSAVIFEALSVSDAMDERRLSKKQLTYLPKILSLCNKNGALKAPFSKKITRLYLSFRTKAISSRFYQCLKNISRLFQQIHLN